MKKMYPIVSILVVLVMLLSACAPAAAPAVEEPAAAEATTAPAAAEITTAPAAVAVTAAPAPPKHLSLHQL